MAERNISTRLILEGEKEYRAQIKQLNAELKTLNSEMKLVESASKGQANTVEALTAKIRVLSEQITKQNQILTAEKAALDQAKRLQEQYAAAADNARAKMAALADSTDEAGRETDEYRQAMGNLQAEINRYEAAERKAAAAVESHAQKANNAEAKINDLNRELEQNSAFLQEAKASADGCATSIDAYGKRTKEAAKESADFGKTSVDAVSTLASALAAAGIGMAFREIVDAIKAASEASMEFESAITGVFKTVDATQEQMAAITDGIQEMALRIPAGTTEIAAVAEAAGQLGIKTDDILNFTEVMINLGVSTNLSAEEAATALARFANVTGMSADQYEALGSTIVALGNNFATTESEVVNMATRIASAGAQIGLTEADIMGVAAALSSLGLEAEAGGTAISKLMIDMSAAVATGSADLDDFAAAAGMTAQEFADLFSQDAVGAMSAFFQGLGSGGQDAIVTLKDMGIEEVRLRDTILRLTSAQDLFARATETAGKAMRDNTALAEEAGKRYATTESKVQLAKNAFAQLKVTVGDVLAPALRNLADARADAFSWAAALIEDNPWIIQALAGIAGGLTALGAAVAGVSVYTKILVPLWQTFTTTLGAASFGPAALAIAAVGTALALLATSAEEADTRVKDHLETVKKSAGAYQEISSGIDTENDSILRMVGRLKELTAAEGSNADSKGEILALVDSLNEAIPDLNLAYDEQEKSLNMAADALERLAEAQYADSKREAALERYNELYRENAEGAALLEEAETKLAEATERLAEVEASYSESQKIHSSLYESEVSSASLAVLECQEQVEALTAAQEANNAEMESLSATYGDFRENLGMTIEATGSLTEGTILAADSVVGKMTELQEAYQEAYTSIYDTMTQQIGLFEQVDATATQTVEDMIGALDSQLEFMAEYAANLQEAMRLGVDEGLIKELSDGSIESAKILAAIVEDGGRNIDELNDKLAAVQEGKEDFASELAAAQTDFDQTAGEIQSTAQAMISNLNSTMSSFDASGLLAEAQQVLDMIQRLEAASSQIGSIRRGIDGSHAGGLYSVPYDGYIAELHQGERVLTAMEARAYRAQENITNNAVNLGGIVINYSGGGSPAEARAAGAVMADEIQRKLRQKGVMAFGL